MHDRKDGLQLKGLAAQKKGLSVIEMNHCPPSFVPTLYQYRIAETVE